MLTGDENIADVKFRVIWKIDEAKPEDYAFNVANPAATVKAVAESAMREDRRPHANPEAAHRRAQGHRAGRAAPDAGRARRLQGGRAHPSGAVAVGRSAGLRHLGVPRRDRRAAGPRPPEERGRSLCQQGRAGSARPGGAHRAGGRRLSRADDRRRARPGLALHARSTSSTRRRPTSRASGSISKRWNGCSASPRR